MLENVLLIISVLLIAIVLLQGNKATDGGNLFNGSNSELFQNLKERGVELVITRTTLVLGIAFFLVSLIIFLK